MRGVKVAVCIPSRGLIHSRTIEAVNRELDSVTGASLYVTHDLPIPISFNRLIDRAFSRKSDYIWLVEEDVVPTKGLLSLMLSQNEPIVAADYPINITVNSVRTRDGEVIFCGTGCVLIKAEVFKKIGYFSIDTEYTWPDLKPYPAKREGYGRHDIDFFIRAKKAGYDIKIVGKVEHLAVQHYGEPGTNWGYHKIISKGGIE